MKKILFLALVFLATSFSITMAQSVTEIAKTLPIAYSDAYNDAYGKTVSIDGDYAVVGVHGHINSRGCAYVLHNTGSEWETLAKLKAENDSINDFFGCSVSIFGDIIVVGAYGDDNAAESSGSTYVFEKPASGWANMTQTAKLTADDAAINDYFGYSVSIFEEIIVVGAYGDDDIAESSGSAYVFEKSESDWTNMTQTAKLTADDAAEYDSFGSSVSISDNVIIVGANSVDGGEINFGAVYAYEKPGSNWTDMTQTAKLTADDAAKNDKLGYSVSISGNVIVAGTPYTDENNSNSGSIYIFEKLGSNWADMTQTAKLTADNSTTNNNLGKSVSISDDIIIGGARGKESAYIFEKPASGWTDMTQTAEIKSSTTAIYNSFGCAVSISGDAIIVGSSGDDDNGENSGSAYIFEKVGSNWTDANETYKTLPIPYLSNLDNKYGSVVAIDGNYAVISSESYKNSNSCAYVLFFDGTDWITQARLTTSGSSTGYAYSTSISGDIIVLGSQIDNTHKGIVYLFKKPVNGWIDMNETAKLTADYGNSWDYLGSSVSISGNVVVTGAYRVESKGAAYIFEKPASGWENMTQTAKITAGNSNDQDKFGYSVSISGDVIVVGAHKNDEKGTESGAAYVFEKPASGWVDMTETAQLIASDQNDMDEFGNSVNISGNTIVVGSIHGSDYKGTAYIFEKPEGGWVNTSETAKLAASDADFNLDFGCSVNISGNILAIGSKSDNDNGLGSGSVYLFEKPISGWGDTTETIKITASDGAENDFFGISIAVSGDVILTGAYMDDDHLDDSGSAYFYKYCSNTFSDNISDALICRNNETSFKVNYIIEGVNINYQWQIDSVNNWENLTNNSIFSGVTTNTLNINPATIDLDSSLFRCKITNYCGDIISNTSLLKVINLNATINEESICNGNSIPLSLSTNSNYPTESGTLSYKWTPSESLDADNIEEPTANPDTTTIYTLVLSDEKNCTDTTTVEVFVQNPYPIHICMVTVDTSENENLIVWEKPENEGIDYFNIYKEGISDSYALIGTRRFDEISEFIDTSSAPSIHADKYKVSVVDTCGNESDLSPSHQTMNLSQAQGAQDDELVLIWNKYIDESGDFVPPSYKVYRGINLNSMTLESTLSGTLSSYNYNIKSVVDGEHFIVVVDMPECNPSETHASGGPYYQSTSNIEDEGIIDTDVKNIQSINFNIYPNPVEKIATITSNQIINTVTIYNITGELIKQYTNINNTRFQFNRTNIVAGTYFIRVNGITHRKLIFE